MLFFIITFCLYLLALLASTWLALATSGVFWEIVAILLWVAGGFILLRTLWNVVYSVLSRLSFCAKLKKYAEKNGFSYTEVRHPLRSFFKVYAGEDILLDTGEKSFRIKFFPYFIRKRIVHIMNEKEAILSKQWALFFVNNRFYVPSGRGRSLTEEMMERKKKIDLSFPEENGTPLLLLSPTCYKITCVRGNTREPIDNDYLYGGRIRIYYQKAFFTCLERLLEE